MSFSLPKHTIPFPVFAVAIVATALLTGVAPAHGKDSGGKSSPVLESSPLKHGAQLYDNWPKLKGDTPQGSHPLYPAAGKKRRASL